LVLIKKGAIFSCKDNKKIDEKIENLVSQLNFLSVNEKKIIKEKTINLRNIYFENKLIFDDYYTIVKEIINEDIIASNEILKYILYDLRLLNDVNENNNRQIFIEKIKEKYNVGKYPKSYVLYRFFKLLKL
jgi:hypothetical protein